MRRRIKDIAFALFCLTILGLAVTSLLDNITGEAGTSAGVYHSAPFALLWGVLTVLALVHALRRRLWRTPATLLIHVAFAVILAGALVTHLWGQEGRIHLREQESSRILHGRDGTPSPLPFTVQLLSFDVEYYPHSSAPRDYVSRIVFTDPSGEQPVTISMNNIATHRHYRFCQAGYDDDLHGSTLLVTHDPWGIALTYSGYLLLLLAMLLFWLQRGSQYRRVFLLWRADRQSSSGRVMRWLPCGSFLLVLSIVALVMFLRWTSAPLLPVLRSPFFPLHVTVIMISYVLLVFVMLNGFRAMLLPHGREDREEQSARLMRSSQLMLLPALFLLIAGIFIGALWANVSWGRYWGWDSKEVWALITMMSYSLPLHQQSLPWFARPQHFHAYCALAFLIVLMTYFGVNCFLSGLHSYA